MLLHLSTHLLNTFLLLLRDTDFFFIFRIKIKYLFTIDSYVFLEGGQKQVGHFDVFCNISRLFLSYLSSYF